MNALIIGCGNKFGLNLYNNLKQSGYTVWGVTGNKADNHNLLQVNWDTCDIGDFEKFFRQLPQLDLIIFNQNSPALYEDYLNLSCTDIFKVWKGAKKWKQSHYVNCILPSHALHTLSSCGKLLATTSVTWILSKSMFGKSDSPVDYIGQKYQNYMLLKQLSTKNPQTFIGICPGHLIPQNQEIKAELLINFLKTVDSSDSGRLFVFDLEQQNFVLNLD